MAERLAAAFGDWRKAGAPLPEIPTAERRPGGRVLLVDKPGATQTWFWIGNVGVARTYPRRAALDIANTLFGGRFTSMLNTALRVETGLTYGAQSLLVRPSAPGSVAIDSFTRTDATTEAIDLALDVLQRFRDVTPPRRAVTSARNYVLGQFPMQLETARQLAAQFAMIEATGLTRAWIDGYAEAVDAVRAPDVAEVASSVYPGRGELVFVLIGDAARIRDAVAKYGSVTEMSITEPVFEPPPAPEAGATQSK
jgi:predicted Zn-dependent peptidase